MPVTITAAQGALAELEHGEGQKLDSFLYVRIDDVPECAFVINGKLWNGSHAHAGEFAHIPLMYDAACSCGGRGHLESFFSGAALKKAGEQNGYGSDWKTLWANRENRWIARHFSTAMNALACALLGAMRLLDPECVILAGSIARSDDFLDDLTDYMLPLNGANLLMPKLLLSRLDDALILNHAQ